MCNVHTKLLCNIICDILVELSHTAQEVGLLHKNTENLERQLDWIHEESKQKHKMGRIIGQRDIFEAMKANLLTLTMNDCSDCSTSGGVFQTLTQIMCVLCQAPSLYYHTASTDLTKEWANNRKNLICSIYQQNKDLPVTHRDSC